MKKIFKIVGALLAALLVLPVAIGLIWKSLTPNIPAPGKLYDVGGHRLHINCTGPDNDLPTVIVEAGLGGPTPFYHWVQENLSQTGKVCTYDRAGLGWSEESGKPHDAENIANQLHTLLEKAEVKKPFVFAGHSLAGLIMRVYVGAYPEDVLGVAFLDASHPNQNEVLKLGDDGTAVMKKMYGVLETLNALGLTKFYNPMISMSKGGLPESAVDQLEFVFSDKYFNASLAEMVGFDASTDQALSAGDLGDRPVVVVTAGKPATKEQVPEHVDPLEMKKAWLVLQDELSQLSTRGKHVVIKEADHMSLISDKDFADQASELIREIVMENARVEPVS